jgi:hypothetical protein
MGHEEMDILLDILTREQQGWVALVVATLSCGYLLFKNRFRRKKDPLERTPFSSLSQQRTVEREMQNLLVELSEMTRQMNAQIDTRAAKLEQLIGQADERIATLRNTDVGPAASSGGKTEQAAPVEIAAPRPVIPIAQPLPEDSAPAESDSRHAEIYSMADDGRDAREIAARLNRPSGEVELILALRPRV